MDKKLAFTVYDILAYLIPGGILFLTIYYTQPWFTTIPKETFVTLSLFSSYTLGIIVNLLGHILFVAIYYKDREEKSLRYKIYKYIDDILDHFPLRKIKTPLPEINSKLSDVINEKLKINVKDNKLGQFVIADTIVANSGFTERDILLSKESFFRSMTALTIIEGVYLMLYIKTLPNLIFLAITLLLIYLFRYMREYYRTLKNQQIYTLAYIKIYNDKLDAK